MSAVFPTDYPNDVDDLPMDRQVSQLRIPPHSIEAESSVLGGLLLDNGAWDRVGDLLIDSDFYRYEHRLIYGSVEPSAATTAVPGSSRDVAETVSGRAGGAVVTRHSRSIAMGRQKPSW